MIEKLQEKSNINLSFLNFYWNQAEKSGGAIHIEDIGDIDINNS